MSLGIDVENLLVERTAHVFDVDRVRRKRLPSLLRFRGGIHDGKDGTERGERPSGSGTGVEG
jgi:hypothetical protein